MKKFLIAAGFIFIPVALNAGELVIMENEGSQVSLKAIDNQLSVNGATLPVATLVGRDPADKNQVIPIGPAIGDISNNESLVAFLIEYKGKNYRVEMDISADGGEIRGSGRGNAFYSDSNCNNVFARAYIVTRAIESIASENGVTYDLYSVDPENRVPVTSPAYFYYNGNGCSPTGGDGTFPLVLWPFTKLPISEQELLKGAVPPYSVIYK